MAARPNPEIVLDFWFGPLDRHGMAEETFRKRWFKRDATFDAEIAERFGNAVEAALSGVFDPWADESARARLALVILLDQFPRNVYRDDPRAFSGDLKAQGMAREAVEQGIDTELLAIERYFLYMPFMHAESRAVQAFGLECFTLLAETAPDAAQKLCQDALYWAERHKAVIDRFGRFPHRNACLGRETTPEEAAFLKENETGF